MPDENKSSTTSYVVLAIGAFLGLILLPFVPLMLALLEGAVFGTRYVEDFFETIGLHDELDALYEPIVETVRRFFP